MLNTQFAKALAVITVVDVTIAEVLEAVVFLPGFEGFLVVKVVFLEKLAGQAHSIRVELLIVFFNNAKVGEVDGLLCKDLVILVTLATDEDDVAGACALESRADGLLTVSYALLLDAWDADNNLINDGLWVFATRVVAGDDADIAVLASSLAHEGTLALVAVATAAKDGDESAIAAELLHRAAYILNSIGGMGVVDKALDVVDAGHKLKAAWYLRSLCEAANDIKDIDACGTAACNSGEAVGDVKGSNEGGAHQVALLLILELKLIALE